ncbi:hypothetical protein PAXRUDRAFT_73549, partial [Paxillus rubicundulus Ve08.2h10]
PCPYLSDLTPNSSPFHPHCLAADWLHLWRPFGTAGQIVTVALTSHTISEDMLDHILQVIRASWADNTKAIYRTGLLIYHIYCNLNSIPKPHRCPTSPSLLSAFL